RHRWLRGEAMKPQPDAGSFLHDRYKISANSRTEGPTIEVGSPSAHRGRMVNSMPATLHGLFESQVRRAAQALAVGCGDERLTYRQLDQRARALAQRLKQSGVSRGSLVGLCAERSVDLAVAVLAIVKAGAAYVPLDPVYPPQRLAFMLADSGIEVLVCQRAL